MNLTPWETGMHRLSLTCCGYWVALLLSWGTEWFACLVCFANREITQFPTVSQEAQWLGKKASSLGTNTTRANKQVLIPLIVGKSLNPFRQVLCNHCPLRRMAFLLGLPACSTGWWLNLLQEFCILTLPLVILYILLIVLCTPIIFYIFQV